MRKSAGSFIASNRKTILVLGVVLGLALLGVITLRTSARINSDSILLDEMRVSNAGAELRLLSKDVNADLGDPALNRLFSPTATAIAYDSISQAGNQGFAGNL